MKENISLAAHTTFKIGGPARYFLEVKTADECVRAVKAAKNALIPVFFLGGGSNILVSDTGFDGLVIKNAMRGISFVGRTGGNTKHTPNAVYIKALSGTFMNQLVRFTVDNGLGGLQMHLGLPGTVGGAVAMNAKWTHPNGYVGDAVFSATVMTAGGEIKSVGRSYFDFSYGYSSIQKTGDIILDTIFALHPGDKDALWEIANTSIRYRRNTQPQGVFTAGCVFKNTVQSAGYLVDHSGISSRSFGGAAISDVHANFIVNSGSATSSDVLKLMDLMKTAVKNRFGVELEKEVLYVGEK